MNGSHLLLVMFGNIWYTVDGSRDNIFLMSSHLHSPAGLSQSNLAPSQAGEINLFLFLRENSQTRGREGKNTGETQRIGERRREGAARCGCDQGERLPDGVCRGGVCPLCSGEKPGFKISPDIIFNSQETTKECVSQNVTNCQEEPYQHCQDVVRDVCRDTLGQECRDKLHEECATKFKEEVSNSKVRECNEECLEDPKYGQILDIRY